MSLTSSVFNFESEGGRQYTANIMDYPLPNDERELERELKQHKLFLEITNGRLFLAPIGTKFQKVLDIGTGEGKWLALCTDYFPGSWLT